LNVFGVTLQEAPMHLKTAVRALRACYDSKVEFPEFRAVRSDVHASAVMFRDGLLPLTGDYLKVLDYYFRQYVVWDFETWHSELAELFESASAYQGQGRLIGEGYTLLREEFTRARNKARELMQTMDAAAKESHQQAQVVHGFAVTAEEDTEMEEKEHQCLTMMFGPMGKWLQQRLNKERVDAARQRYAVLIENLGDHTKHKQAADMALEVIRNTLILSIDGFNDTMKLISDFFTGLKNEIGKFMRTQAEVQKLQGKAKDEKQAELTKKMQLHHHMMKTLAQRVSIGIIQFLNVFDEVQVQMECLPLAGDASKASLQEWMQRTAEGKAIIMKILTLPAFQSHDNFPNFPKELKEIVDAAPGSVNVEVQKI